MAENHSYCILPLVVSQEMTICDLYNINMILTCLMVTSFVNIRKQRQHPFLRLALCFANKEILRAGEIAFPWEENSSCFLFFTSQQADLWEINVCA